MGELSGMAKKKVVYLLGAGATEAVVRQISPLNGLLTRNIQDEIRKNHKHGLNDRVWSELVTEGNDVEHLISVLDSQHDYHAAERVRTLYRDAIVFLSTKISNDPPASNLYAVLLDLHINADKLQEELLCFLSLNYEDVLERTIAVHFGKDIDYEVETSQKTVGKNTAVVLKLHGSFAWKNCRPISVESMTSLTAENTLWIPPGVDKHRENYPFNLLWGKASEYLMSCDILRVVGCSLSRNDWGLIPILYTAQKFNERGSSISIEIIDFPHIAEDIRNRYKYLSISSLIDLPDLHSYYGKLLPKGSRDEIKKLISDTYGGPQTKVNPMGDWLDAKIEHLVVNRKATLARAAIAHKFYHKV